MTRLDQRLLVKQAKGEDPILAERAKMKLLALMEPIVKALANKFINATHKVDLEDLMCEGRLGVLLAVENYNINARATFKTYACFYIKGQMIELVWRSTTANTTKRDRTKSKEEESDLYSLIGMIGGDLEYDDDQHGIPDVGCDSIIDRELAEYLINRLPPRYRPVVEKLFGFNRDMPLGIDVVAESMGLQHTRVAQIKEESIKIMRSIMKKEVDNV